MSLRRAVTFAGYPVSRLVSADGRALAAGKFGVTRDVSVADWEWIAAAYAGTSLAGGTSMGMHEAQSRFFENLVGRSEAFAPTLLGALTAWGART